MFGIATNILARYLTQDDPKQSPLFTEFINKQRQDICIFINCVVWCELVWVLETAYYYNKSIIAAVLEEILQTKQFKIEHLTAVQHTLHAYKKYNTDFANHMIAEINRTYSCHNTALMRKV